MDVLRAAKGSNSRRARSVPGGRARAVYRQSIPRALTDALSAARERFECFRLTKLTGAVGARPSPSAVPAAEEPHSGGGNGGSAEAASAPAPSAPAPAPAPAPSASASASAPSASSPSNSPELQVPAPRCVAFDPVETARAMHERRHVRDRCPAKIAAFMVKLRARIESAAANAPGGVASHPAAANATRQRSGNHFAPVNQASRLGTLDKVWEKRLEEPIAIQTSVVRKKGIFGDAERKELHHLVISVLNRVTNNPEKYHEVKNELLRLPIPEANDVMLGKIVEIFFQKAVQEPHFSQSYADLVTALCKVPEGQRVVGDKMQSLEFRLRQQLLKRCQHEFQQFEELNVQSAACGGEDRKSNEAEEAFKKKRNRACGILRFTGELFIRQVVKESVIAHVLKNALASPGSSLSVPPTYTPTESQMDEVITLLNIVDTTFFETALGLSMLPECTKLLQYWSTEYPVSRIKLLLLSVVDRLKRLVEQEEQRAAPKQNQQKQRPQQKKQSNQQHQTDSLPGGQPVSQCSEDVHSESIASTDRRPATAHSSETTSPTDKAVVFVGGKPIPVPRSAASRNGSTTASINCSLVSNSPVVQAVTTESVAKYMESLTSRVRSMDDVVTEIAEVQSSLIPIVELWTERCLTVVKVEKSRTIYGAFLSSLNAHSKGARRDELRKIAMDAFKHAVGQKLYEDLRIFRYWVSMICSDSKRKVLDEDLLNESLKYLLNTEPGAVKPFLRDVAHALKMTAENCKASDESSNFVRYRPLHVIHCHNTRREQDYELRQVNFTELCAKSLEINVFCALLTDKPSKDEIFEIVRSSVPRSTAFAAPEVLSGILHAELCSNSTHFLDDNLPLLQLVGDGPDREAREILLIAELYAMVKDAPAEGARPASFISRVMEKLERHLISDETKERARRCFQTREEPAQQLVGAHGALQVRGNAGNSNSGSYNNKNSNNNSHNTGMLRRHTSQRR